MPEANESIQALAEQEYKHGWVSEVDADQLPPGLSEDVVRAISAKKNEPEWMLEWRLRAYRHWLTMDEPNWQKPKYPKIDYNG
ncbi:MAG: Fe-S cluster assembly protein SufB, partial [Planctomycetes bacterium]|nr:Fe-S cluster assembly protein SufB [Planctomycetota bacterium]